MFNKLTKWYYPETIDDALSLLEKNTIVLHAGGTGLLRIKSNRIQAIVDLKKLDMTKLSETEYYYVIGSCATFAQIGAWKRLKGAVQILRQAANQAASAPLRNRITVGGSIVNPPAWSDLPPVLLALNAEIYFKGITNGMLTADQYFQNMVHDGESIITEIRIPKLPGKAAFKRVTQTVFDYSMLDLAVYMSLIDGKINNCRIAIGCAVKRAVRITEVEDFLLNKKPSADLFSTAISKINIKLIESKRASKEYRMHLIKVHLKRMLVEECI